MASDIASIVVPTYNATQYLNQIFDSIFSQTYRDFEVIVLDEGSTDDTPIIAQKYEDAVRYIFSIQSRIVGRPKYCN